MCLPFYIHNRFLLTQLTKLGSGFRTLILTGNNEIRDAGAKHLGMVLLENHFLSITSVELPNTVRASPTTLMLLLLLPEVQLLLLLLLLLLLIVKTTSTTTTATTSSSSFVLDYSCMSYQYSYHHRSFYKILNCCTFSIIHLLTHHSLILTISHVLFVSEQTGTSGADPCHQSSHRHQRAYPTIADFKTRSRQARS